MPTHKNAVDERPAHGLAYHPQRGTRVVAHLKSGWRWLSASEARKHARGETLATEKLPKPGVWRGEVGGIALARTRSQK